jgi:Uma2 family endonuclease
MTQAKPRFRTIEEYLDYDDGSDRRYELVDGVLVEMPPESRLNYKIASFLFGTFVKLGVSLELITIGMQIAVSNSKATVRQPDLIVLSQECSDALEGMKSAVIQLNMPTPALVVEIVSPGQPGDQNYDRDYVEKSKEYATRGIPEFWQIDPERAVVRVLTLKGGSYQAREFREGDRIVSLTFPNLQLTAERILSAGR